MSEEHSNNDNSRGTLRLGPQSGQSNSVHEADAAQTTNVINVHPTPPGGAALQHPSIQTFTLAQPMVESVLEIFDGDNKPVITLTRDGNIKLGEGITPEDASMIFWDRLARQIQIEISADALAVRALQRENTELKRQLSQLRGDTLENTTSGDGEGNI